MSGVLTLMFCLITPGLSSSERDVNGAVDPLSRFLDYGTSMNTSECSVIYLVD